MIDHLDRLLRQLLRNRVVQLTSDGQISFEPPDEDWRTLVPTITDGAGNLALSVNVYLIELRENRKLRTNARERMNVGLDVFETPPPRRVDCHYLISTWSPVAAMAGLDPTLDEHLLLAEIARVLGEHDELDPVAIYADATPPAVPPAAIAEEHFPLTLLPPEGFPKMAEFWGTMGNGNRWKPCIYSVITVVLREQPLPAGPMVTTAYLQTQVSGEPATAETWFQIGGTLRASAAPGAAPVADAWVDLRTAAGVRRQLVRTDAQGRFLFVQVAAGSYQLRGTAEGFGPIAINVDVPSAGGGYDIHF